MLWLLSGTLGVYLLDFFCLCFQFYLLSSPYLSFISFSYLDLHVQGDDAGYHNALARPDTCETRPDLFTCTGYFLFLFD